MLMWEPPSSSSVIKAHLKSTATRSQPQQYPLCRVPLHPLNLETLHPANYFMWDTVDPPRDRQPSSCCTVISWNISGTGGSRQFTFSFIQQSQLKPKSFMFPKLTVRVGWTKPFTAKSHQKLYFHCTFSSLFTVFCVYPPKMLSYVGLLEYCYHYMFQFLYFQFVPLLFLIKNKKKLKTWCCIIHWWNQKEGAFQ